MAKCDTNRDFVTNYLRKHLSKKENLHAIGKLVQK